MDSYEDKSEWRVTILTSKSNRVACEQVYHNSNMAIKAGTEGPAEAAGNLGLRWHCSRVEKEETIMSEWGIFNDEAANYTEEESVEAQFYSKEEAEKAIRDRYSDDDLHVHIIEEEEDDDSDFDDDEDEDDSGSYPIPY